MNTMVTLIKKENELDQLNDSFVYFYEKEKKSIEIEIMKLRVQILKNNS